MAKTNSPGTVNKLYKIALSIGNSLNLVDMLKVSLPAYKKNLSCYACSIYWFEKKDNNFKLNNIFSIPYTLNLHKEFTNIEKILPDSFTEESFNKFYKILPFAEGIGNGSFVHVFELPGFGILFLLKRKELLSYDLIESLENLNLKLAQACIACTKNEILADSERRFRNLSELLPEMIFEINPEGKITYANTYAIEKMGYSNYDLKEDFSIFKIIASEDFLLAKKNIIQSLQEDSLKPREYNFVKKNGNIFRGAVYTTRIIENKRAVGIRGAVVDITERKKFEELLIRSEAANRAIIESLPDMLLHFNREGILINYNNSISQISVFNELRVNKNIRKLFPLSIAQKLTDAINICLIKNTYVFEFDMQFETGPIFFECRLAKINKNEVIVLMRNVTDIKQYEENLKLAKEKAEQANNAKDKVFSIISHDMRTPLATLQLVLDKLMNTDITENKDFTLKALRLMQVSANQTHFLLDNLLNWSRGQLKSIKCTPVFFDIVQLIMQNIDLLQNTIDQKELFINFNEKNEIIVFADNDMINTVIRNLLVNSIKFSYDGEKIEIGIERNKQIVTVSISDNGIGLAENNIGKIFDSLTQYPKDGTSGEKGTGLGLGICKSFVEMNQGTIWAENNPEKGCKFSFSIPVSKTN